MKILRLRFLDNHLEPTKRSSSSSIFASLRPLLINLMQDSHWRLCDSSTLNAWTLNSLGQVILEKLGVDKSIFKFFNATIAQFHDNQRWQIQDALFRNFPEVGSDIQNYITLDYVIDKLIWSHSTYGSVTTKALYDRNFAYLNAIPWVKHIWCRFIPHRRSFFFRKLFTTAQMTIVELGDLLSLVVAHFVLHMRKL